MRGQRRRRWVAMIGVVCCALAPGAGWACRYSVRDIGFIDRGDPGMRVVVQGRGLAAVAQQLRERLEASGVDAAVYADDAAQGDRVVLLQGGRSRELATGPAQALARAAFAEMAPTAEVAAVAAELVDRCCVVLLVGGDSAETNQTAQRELAAACRRAVEEADLWEKPMGGEPLVIHWTPEDAQRQPLTLWALGFAPPSDTPQAAVLYGRCRRLGPIFSGDEIESEAVARVIAVLGQDCECDLSRDIFAGPTAPHPWDEGLAERARERLGFDPEHPMTVMEARQILASKPTDKPAEEAFADRHAFLGYEEIDLTAALDGLAGDLDPKPAAETAAPDAVARGATSSAGEPDRSAEEVAGPVDSPYGALAAAVAVLAAVSGLVGWRMTCVAS